MDMEKIPATRFWEEHKDEMRVVRNSFLSYLRRYADELIERGILEIYPRGLRKNYYILDEEKLRAFFKEKKIYVFK